MTMVKVSPLIFVDHPDTERPHCTVEVETLHVQECWESSLHSLSAADHLQISNISVEYEGWGSLNIFHIKINLKRDEDSVAIFFVKVLDVLHSQFSQSGQVGPDITEE